MKIEELKEKVLSEIENNLWRLGEDGEDSAFPNFDLNSHELEYGVQRDNSDFIVETKAKTKTGERILVKLNIELFAE
jgi:hypothetical protein